MASHDELTSKLDAFDQKLERIIDNRGKALSVAGQQAAIGMLVTLNMPIFDEAAKALRNTRAVETELREALKEIAGQKLREELDDADAADFEAGYEGCVRKARAALSNTGDKKVKSKETQP